MALSLKISGTSYTLPQASVRSLVHTVQACQPATLSAQIYASGIPTHSIARDSAIELWVDGVRRFAGTNPKRPLTGYDSQGSYIDLNAVDLLGRLRSITYERPVLTWTGKSTTAPTEWGFPEGTIVPLYKLSDQWASSFGLFSLGLAAMDTDTDGATLYAIRGTSSSEAELVRLSGFLSARHGIDLELGTLAGLPTKNTGDEITALDCLSVLQRCAQLRPDATFWIDPSTGTNRLNYITRDNCTAITLDVNDRTRITANQCVPRDDLQVGYIKFTLNWQVVRDDGSWFPDTLTSEYGDPTCAPERRLIRSFNLGQFGVSTGVSGLPYVWEVPTGAAAAYWAAASVLHYEGPCSVYEPDGVSYAYGLGQVINFSNWQPGYETARALVRGVTYDLVSRRTSIDFGPPDSLTPQDYLSISASSLGSSNPTTSPTDPTTDPTDPTTGPTGGSGDLPAQVTEGLYNLFSVIEQTNNVQVIEGTALLRGHSEYTYPESPSNPPKKYLTERGFGEINFSTLNCQQGSEITGITSAYGWSKYDPVTFTYSNYADGSHNWAESVAGGGFKPTISYGRNAYDALTPQPGYSSSLSSTEVIISGSGSCVLTAWFGLYWCGFGTVRYTLSDEYTEQMAIAALGSTWVDATELSLRTYWQQRTTGFSFAIRRCRLHDYTWTCSIYGLPVRVSIPLYEYPFGGTKPATPTSTQEFTLDLVKVGTTTTSSNGLTLTEYHGKATLPDWEMPFKPGMVVEAGTITITLL